MSNELLRFQTALANSATSPCVIAVIGDSISYGGNWPDLVRQRLQSQYGNGGQGWLPSIGMPQIGSWPLFPLAGADTIKNGSGGTITYTCLGDSLDLVYITGPDTAAGFTVKIDGGAAVVYGAVATADLTPVKLTLALGSAAASHSIVITAPNDGVSFTYQIGALARTGTHGVVMMNLSFPGRTSATFGKYPANLAWVSMFNPALLIAMLGTNDARDETTTFAGYVQTIATVAKGFWPGAPYPVVYLADPYEDPSQAAYPAQAAIHLQFKNAAAANGFVFLDVADYWGTDWNLLYNPAYGLKLMADQFHPTTAGQNYIANNIVLPNIVPAGVTPPPPLPAKLNLLNATLVWGS